MEISKIISKLRAKYPELSEEPMLDQVEAAMAPEAEPMEGEVSMDEEEPAEDFAEEPTSEMPGKPKRKRKLSEMPAPEFDDGEEFSKYEEPTPMTGPN